MQGQDDARCGRCFSVITGMSSGQLQGEGGSQGGIVPLVQSSKTHSHVMKPLRERQRATGLEDSSLAAAAIHVAVVTSPRSRDGVL